MLTQTEWNKIKDELKKNIEPLFKEADITFSVPFEQILDIFQGVLNKNDLENSISGRDDIEILLKIVYVEGNIKLAGSTLDVLSGKLEGYLRKVFKIANQPLFQQGNGMLAHHLKTIFRIFRAQKNHIDFTNFTEDFIREFFDKSKANYNNPDFFVSAHKLGGHFKKFYSSRNEEGHLYAEMRFTEIFSVLDSILITYLYVTYLYSDVLKPKTIHQPDTTTVSNWGIFSQYCGSFQKNQSYFLVIDKLNLTDEQLTHFANIKWDFVFDFDVSSENDGLYSAVTSAGYFPQTIHQIIHTSDDRGRITATFPSNTTFWYFPQGNIGRQKSLVQSTRIADWRTLYGRYTQDLLLEYYSNNYSYYHKPIKVVILSKDVERIKEIAYAIKGMNPNLNVEFIFANENNSSLLRLIDEISGKRIDLPQFTLIDGLREMRGVMFSSNNSNEIYLPCHSSKGKSILLPNDDVLSVKQYFQIIHLGILNTEEEQLSDKSFYQGRKITWKELDNRYDVDRSITKDIIKSIKSLLGKRAESEIVYLTHYAGVGGSTVAKRVAFELYKDYPVLFLNEVVSSFNETLLVEKLIKVFQVTELPALVIVDNSNIPRQQIEILERVAGNRLAKTVFLLVESTFSEPRQRENRFYLPSSLDVKEIERFNFKFSKEYPTKEENFAELLKQNYNTLNAFYFGLIANEKEYININTYVSRRLEEINNQEKDLLKLLAFCQIFAKGKLREVPHFVISNFLNIDEEFIRLKKHTQNQKIHDLIIETESLTWKTIHPIIAEEILNQVLGVNDLGDIDVYALKEFAIELIKSLRSISDHRNEEVLELLHNLFILRDDEERTEIEEESKDFSDNLYNRRLFSKLLNDLDNNNNRIEVFDILTTEFPDENAHFWGHFSRLCSIDKDFERALETIDKALEIDDDYIFYHIKGMCYRTELYRLKDGCWGDKGKAKMNAEEMRANFDKASEAFGIARSYGPQKEHGYVAFIQMVMQMIEFEYSISTLKTPSRDYTQFITANSWCRDILTQANEVINDYNNNNREFQNPRIREKQLQLLKFFGEKDKMVNAWNNLLDRREFDQNLVRRQLCYALLAKNEFDWENAKGKDINRIVEHIEENLKNKVEVRDLRLWFEASRRLNSNINELIKKVEQWEFQKPSLDTAYYLMCLFGVQAINGVKSGVDNYEKYQKKVSERINTPYSKVFCVEWAGSTDNSVILINNKQVGVWVRDKQFFEVEPTNLLRVKGKVIKYISRMQGFIEIESVGMQVMYQPALCNHFSDDAQKGTKVEFYLGFNYDGARAFQVENE